MNDPLHFPGWITNPALPDNARAIRLAQRDAGGAPLARISPSVPGATAGPAGQPGGSLGSPRGGLWPRARGTQRVSPQPKSPCH